MAERPSLSTRWPLSAERQDVPDHRPAALVDPLLGFFGSQCMGDPQRCLVRRIDDDVRLEGSPERMRMSPSVTAITPFIDVDRIRGGP